MVAPQRCVRCRQADAALAVREAAYCRTCYARVFDGKVRASLDLARGAVLWHSVVRSTPQRTTPALAVAFSGSLHSCVLLQAVHRLLRTAPGGAAGHALPAPRPARAAPPRGGAGRASGKAGVWSSSVRQPISSR